MYELFVPKIDVFKCLHNDSIYFFHIIFLIFRIIGKTNDIFLLLDGQIMLIIVISGYFSGSIWLWINCKYLFF